MARLKDEFNNFLKDIEQNLKNEKDIEYVKERFAQFFDAVSEQIDCVLTYKEEKIKDLEDKQKDMFQKMEKMQHSLENIERDIYSEEAFDFEIICPYCDNQFVIDIDETKNEVECPECNNIIELDWSGDLENNERDCSMGCSGCCGCDDTITDDNKEDVDNEEEKDTKNKNEDNEDDM